MTTTVSYLILLTLATGATTIFLRAFPFLLFASAKQPPKIITDLGALIAPASIAMLVVYCYCMYFNGTPLPDKAWGAAELIAGAVVVILHLIRGNPLLSIIAGTTVYMALIQYVFC